MIILFNEKKDCCGCTACKYICPVMAIEMIADEEGFTYPRIDEEKCIECGLCKKVCAFQNGHDTNENYKEPLPYAAINTDERIRNTSSSGGVFSAIAERALNDGGIVYGAAFDDKMNVVHIGADKNESLSMFRGSKYVQSDLRDVFLEIRKKIKGGEHVMFSGTPCQCAGLKSFLVTSKVNCENLFLCDIICHGVPSPMIWRKYLEFVENRHGKLSSYSFRDKGKGWRGFNILAIFENGSEFRNEKDIRTYITLYYSDLITRPACHNCKYTNLNRPSDITIGDFWGIEKSIPDIDDNKGVSLVLLNTSKGKSVFEKNSGELDLYESDLKLCMQKHLHETTPTSFKREKFWSDLHKYGMRHVLRKYANFGIVNSLREFIIKLLRKLGLYKTIKRFIGGK